MKLSKRNVIKTNFDNFVVFNSSMTELPITNETHTTVIDSMPTERFYAMHWGGHHYITMLINPVIALG